MKSISATRDGRTMPYVYGAILAILGLHWITVLLTFNDPAASSTVQAVWFDLDREYNVPTVFNSLLLLTSGVVCIGLASKALHRIQRIGWALFSMLFIYLSLDELLIIHEQLAEPIRKILDITGSNPLYHAWVVPAIFIIAFMVLGVWVIRSFHKDLHVFSDTLLYIVILATGVVACEVLGTFVYPYNFTYRMLMVPLEEIFELTMAAVILSHLLAQLFERSKGGKKTKTA
jgi:hypothetical protein